MDEATSGGWNASKKRKRFLIAAVTEGYGSTASFPLLAWGLQRSTVGLADRAPTIEASPQRGSQAVEDDEHLAAFVTEYG